MSSFPAFPIPSQPTNISAIWAPERTNLDGQSEYDQLLAIALGPYRWTLLANAAFVWATFPFCLFLILRRSPPELSGCIRAILFISTLTCAVHASWHAFIQHVPLFPCFVGFSVGYFRSGNVLGIDGVMAIGMQILSPTILTLNFKFAFIHYYAMMNPMWKLAKFFTRLNPVLCILYLAAFIINIGLVFWMVSTMIIPYEKLEEFIDEMMANQTFQHIVFANESSLLGIAVLDCLFWIAEACFYVWIGGQAILVVLLNIWILMKMKTMRSNPITKGADAPSNGALRALRIAYRMFLAKTLLLLVFFFIPFGIINLSISDTIHTYYPSIACFALISLYSSVVYLQMMFLVKPYRRWILATLICAPKKAAFTSNLRAISGTILVRPSNQFGRSISVPNAASASVMTMGMGNNKIGPQTQQRSNSIMTHVNSPRNGL